MFPVKQRLRDLLLMTAGTLFVAVGTYFFKFPNNFSLGGVTGLAVLLTEVLPWPAATISAVINLLFLVLGFVVLNRGFGLKTVYCSLLFSGALQLLEWVCPLSGPLTDSKMLELFFAVVLPAFGSAILFNIGASTGGTDITAMILKKYTSLDIGKALLICDVVIAAGTFFIFDVETGLYCVLGLVLKSVLVDSVIESLNRRKSVLIVTTKETEICDYITHTLHRSATVWNAVGPYTGEEHHVVLTAVSRAQALAVRRYAKLVDGTSFVLVLNSSEIFGKGFLRA